MSEVTCSPLPRRALIAFGVERVGDGRHERHALRPLGAEVGRHLPGGDTPHLLVVAAEEVLVEPPPELAHVEALEVAGVLGRADLHPRVGAHTPHRLHRAEVAQGVDRLERVVVELAPVEDPRHPGALEELLLAEDLEPEVVDLADLGEEPVTADVEAPAVTLDGPADPAHGVVGLEDRGGHAPLHQLVRRGQPGRPRADDHDARCGRFGRVGLRHQVLGAWTAVTRETGDATPGPSGAHRRPR